MTMEHDSAGRLTPDAAAKYQRIRDQIAQELPELIARHHERQEMYILHVQDLRDILAGKPVELQNRAHKQATVNVVIPEPERLALVELLTQARKITMNVNQWPTCDALAALLSEEHVPSVFQKPNV